MKSTAYPGNQFVQSIHLSSRRTALAFLAAVVLAPASAPAQKAGGYLLEQVLGAPPSEFFGRLEQIRPPAVSAEVRARVLRMLPREGEVTDLNESRRRKLASLVPVLSAHGRQAAYDLKVISVPQAFVGLYERTAVLLSALSVDMLNAKELQALVAHEIGHDYVWPEFESARQRKDNARLRELELYCDGVAIATLHRIGEDPSALPAAIRKVSGFNRARFGLARNEDAYPVLSSREAFAKSMIQAVRAAAGAVPNPR